MAVTPRVVSHLLLLVGATAISVGAGLLLLSAGLITGGVLAVAYALTMIDVDRPWRIEVKRR